MSDEKRIQLEGVRATYHPIGSVGCVPPGGYFSFDPWPRCYFALSPDELRTLLAAAEEAEAAGPLSQEKGP